MGKNIKGGRKHKKYKNKNHPLRKKELISADSDCGGFTFEDL